MDVQVAPRRSSYPNHVHLNRSLQLADPCEIIHFRYGKWEFGMKTKVNLNFKLLVQCVVLSLIGCGALFGGAYLGHLALSVIFSSTAVFFSLFAVSVALGVLFLYDAEAFQWDNNPRIALRRVTERHDEE